MGDQRLTTVTVDGLAVETTDAGAQAIAKVQRDLAAFKTASDAAAEAHKTELAAKDRELAAKDAEIDELKGKVLDEAALDAQVRERADLIATATKIADKDYSGMSADKIRAAAVEAVAGRPAVDGKSADYIAARFDMLAETVGQDGVRKVLHNKQQPKVANDAAAHHAKWVEDLSKGYLQQPAGGVQ